METAPWAKFTAALAAVTGEPMTRPSDPLDAMAIEVAAWVASVITSIPPL